MFVAYSAVVFLLKVTPCLGVKLDLIDCGVDHSTYVPTGEVPITDYPWFGILYYINEGEAGELRAVTPVVLIHKLFVVGAAADIGPMPKHDFRLNSRVLLGERWEQGERRVRNYVLHPEYSETMNTIALVQLKQIVVSTPYLKIRPVCPPPDLLRNPTFYVMKFNEDYNILRKEVIPVLHVPADLCKEFYIAANLYAVKMRPPNVVCVTSAAASDACVWTAGGALVSRDAWGRWMLLGIGTRGPGCGAPSRFLDMMTYFPWIEHSLSRFSSITISPINKHKYVLRSSGDTPSSFQRFGDCDTEEQKNLIFREFLLLKTDNNQYQFLTYNLTIYDAVEYTCLTLELVNASASSEMRVQHICPRKNGSLPCHEYKLSTFDISVYMMFSEGCRFEMKAWGQQRKMTLLDIQEWKWEEGTYYEDFSASKVEYKGSSDQTAIGFEPVDEKLWIPDYDLWAPTEVDNTTTTTPTPDVDFLNSNEEPPLHTKSDLTTIKLTSEDDEETPKSFHYGIGLG